MYLENNKEKILLKECKSFYSRLKGFMFNRKPLTYALLFKNCRSIHTFFMYQNIAVVFTDKHNKVIAYYPNVKPNKILMAPRNVANTYELKPYFFENDIINQILPIKK